MSARELCCYRKKCFLSTGKRKAAFTNSSSAKSAFEKLRLRDGLEWTVDPTVEIKLRFQFSPAFLDLIQNCRLSVISVSGYISTSF